jgi:hypothetical protein
VDGTGRAVVDLTNLAAANGFVIQGDAANDQVGWSVSSAGEVYGDGVADLIGGARFGGGRHQRRRLRRPDRWRAERRRRRR